MSRSSAVDLPVNEVEAMEAARRLLMTREAILLSELAAAMGVPLRNPFFVRTAAGLIRSRQLTPARDKGVGMVRLGDPYADRGSGRGPSTD